MHRTRRVNTENLSVRITFDFTRTTYLVRRGKLFLAPSPKFSAVNVLLGNAQVKSYSPNSEVNRPSRSLPGARSEPILGSPAVHVRLPSPGARSVRTDYGDVPKKCITNPPCYHHYPVVCRPPTTNAVLPRLALRALRTRVPGLGVSQPNGRLGTRRRLAPSETTVYYAESTDRQPPELPRFGRNSRRVHGRPRLRN